jgi:hypothetical protein
LSCKAVRPCACRLARAGPFVPSRKHTLARRRLCGRAGGIALKMHTREANEPTHIQ